MQKLTYKVTGLVFLIVGLLFFLRDIGVNYIGNTSGFSIVLVLIGFALVAGGGTEMARSVGKGAK